MSCYDNYVIEYRSEDGCNFVWGSVYLFGVTKTVPQISSNQGDHPEEHNPITYTLGATRGRSPLPTRDFTMSSVNRSCLLGQTDWG